MVAVATQSSLNAANAAGKLHYLIYSDPILTLEYLIIRLQIDSDKRLKFFMSFFLGGKAETIFARVTSFIQPGTKIYPANANRNFSPSPGYQAYVDPTLTGVYEERIIPSLGSETGRGLHFPGAHMITCGGFILRPNSEYFVSLRNLETTTAQLGIFVSSMEI